MSKNGKIVLGIILVVLAVIVFVVAFAWRGVYQAKNFSTAGYGLGMREEAGVATGLGGSFGVRVAAEEPSMAKSIDSVAPQNDSAKSTERLIIKTGSLALVVEDVKSAVAGVVKYAADNGGFVVYSNIYKSGLSPVGEVTIRIPAKIFDQGVGEVKKLGEVKSESVNGQDVTEEYVDLESQLKNLRASETQFLQIMARAERIEDVLAVQRELTIVRGQIESIQGRMKYLTQSAELSTLTVYLSTDPSVLPAVDQENKWKPWAEVKTAARSLLVVARGLGNLVIWLVVYLPLWLAITGIVWLVRKWWKRRKGDTI